MVGSHCNPQDCFYPVDGSANVAMPESPFQGFQMLAQPIMIAILKLLDRLLAEQDLFQHREAAQGDTNPEYGPVLCGRRPAIALK